jgi:hypothetical protein
LKTRFSILAILFCAFLLPAQTNPPIRLAIVQESAGVDAVSDLLTVEFSKSSEIHLLERAEIDRIYREQGLSAQNKDYLKLGQILGADGLLLLQTGREGTNQILVVELIAVKPGVLLLRERFKWPLENAVEWAAAVEKLVRPLTPKLNVLAKDAIPISILNLRSAIQSAESREAERQLTILAIERLSREPRLFVLERRSMQLLTTEKELKGLDDSAFWHGSYLLDGTLDNHGYSKDTITITARLSPANGKAPAPIEASGSRTNYAEVINQFADKLLAALNVARSAAPWNAAAEAEQFYAEAQWALKWNLYPEARAGAESAWALGKRNSDSAGALFQAYSESVPTPWVNSSELYVHALPDMDPYPLFTRALEILAHNPTEFFCGTNSSTIERFTLGYGTLFKAAGQLESYYYAAEARPGHEEQLAELRKQMRDAFSVMNAHPMLETNRPWMKGIPQDAFNKLEWEEGGVCFDRPEDALPFYRQLLKNGAHPNQLPRLIGWTWPDRQRVRPTVREFVREICNDTNPVTRLEGLYLALLLAPNDEQGSVARAEQELISAIWDSREMIFEHPEILSLLDRTAGTIGNISYDAPNQIVHHEPITSFKEQMRVYFLQNAPTNIWRDLGALFGMWGRPVDTPEQARELLPLATIYQQKLNSPQMMADLIERLTKQAGIPEPKLPAEPLRAAEHLVEAKFIPWKLKQFRLGTEYESPFHGTLFRNGQIWTRVGYQTRLGSSNPDQFGYLSVDPENGASTEIPFPGERGGPGYLFEVSPDALFVESGEHILRFRFREKAWDEIAAPLEGAKRMVWAGDRLFISHDEGLISVQPDTKSIQVLVSSRRKPPANDIDTHWPPGTMIYPQPNGKLGALTGERCFTFDPATESWTTRNLPSKEGGAGLPLRVKFSSTGGSQGLLSGPFSPRYMVGFWNDNSPFQSFLLEKTRYQWSLNLSNILEPTRWDWPAKFPLEPSYVSSEDQKLWILCPRLVWPINPQVIHEPILFSDNRQATLIYFESEFRQPLSSGIHFEITSESKDPLTKLTPTEQTRYYFGDRNENVDFWVKSPTGLIFTTRSTPGHWFISNASLKGTFDAQRQAQRKSSTSPAKQANLEKP